MDESSPTATNNAESAPASSLPEQQAQQSPPGDSSPDDDTNTNTATSKSVAGTTTTSNERISALGSIVNAFRPLSMSSTATSAVVGSSASASNANAEHQSVRRINTAVEEDDVEENLNAYEHRLFTSIVLNKRREPLTQAELQSFLDKHHCGELLRFYLEVNALENAVEQMKPRSAVFDLAQRIVDNFIRVRSPNEINISSKDRTWILESFEKMDPPTAPLPQVVGLFARAKTETYGLMFQGPFKQFLDVQMNTNITPGEARSRAVAAGVLFLVVFVILGVLMWLQVTSPDPLLQERWWRLVTLPFAFWGFGSVLSSRARVCTGLAAQCVRMQEKDSWLSVIRGKQGPRAILDELTLERISARAKRIRYGTYVWTVVFMVVIVAVPPGYS